SNLSHDQTLYQEIRISPAESGTPCRSHIGHRRKPLSLLIHEHAGSTSPADRQLADVILSFPGDIASYTAVELAKMAGISNAAVSRFVHKLGFRNYEDMKRHAPDLRSEGVPNYLLEKDPTDTVGQIARHVHFGQQNIAETF